MAVGGAVELLVEQMRQPRQAAQPLLADASFIAELQRQRRDQRDEVGVAAALAEPVQRPLDLARPGADRGDAVGDGVLGVVVAMDAEPVAGDLARDRLDDARDLVGERPAVGVAEDRDTRPGSRGGLERLNSLLRVGPVAVEEVLRVVKHLAALTFAVSD